MILLYFLVIILLLYSLRKFTFWYTHHDPLNENEVKLLAEKRRTRDINTFYSFVNVELKVNKQLKSEMKASGSFYRTNIMLSDMPAIAASFLKSKKHEWILLAFEKNKEIKYLWMNKGSNNVSVDLLKMNSADIVLFSETLQISTVLAFHNHPNSNPDIFNYAKASQIDMDTANRLSGKLSIKGINHIAFVCERGRFYRYFFNCVDNFLPISRYIETLNSLDTTDRQINYSLHKELRSSQNIESI